MFKAYLCGPILLALAGCGPSGAREQETPGLGEVEAPTAQEFALPPEQPVSELSDPADRPLDAPEAETASPAGGEPSDVSRAPIVTCIYPPGQNGSLAVPPPICTTLPAPYIPEVVPAQAVPPVARPGG